MSLITTAANTGSSALHRHNAASYTEEIPIDTVSLSQTLLLHTKILFQDFDARRLQITNIRYPK